MSAVGGNGMFSAYPKEMLRSRRWAAVVEGRPLGGLSLEQAVLAAVLSMAEGVAFELGGGEGEYWGALRFVRVPSHGLFPVKQRLLGPAAFSVADPTTRNWVYFFRSARPAKEIPSVLASTGFVLVSEKLMGKEVPYLSEEKLAELEEALATLAL